MKNQNIILAVVSILAIIFFIGWVLPKVPFSQRLSAEDAETLYSEYLNIISKFQGLDAAIRRNEIAQKLTQAGYTIVTGNDNIHPLLYPTYAQ